MLPGCTPQLKDHFYLEGLQLAQLKLLKGWLSNPTGGPGPGTPLSYEPAHLRGEQGITHFLSHTLPHP